MISFLRRIVNTKFHHIDKSNKPSDFKILDVGAGNQSASKIKKLFPSCEYHGLDLNRDTNYINSDFEVMYAFYELDLTKLELSVVPNNYFDYINMSHVIEHLHNGDFVLPLLISKLKSGGYFYIEYPGRKSLNLPSMYDTLNFYDDSTHVRVYSTAELRPIFESNNCQIISMGTRRNWYYIIALPLRVISSLIQVGKIRGNVFWDLLGFAEYLYVKKN